MYGEVKAFAGVAKNAGMALTIELTFMTSQNQEIVKVLSLLSTREDLSHYASRVERLFRVN